MWDSEPQTGFKDLVRRVAARLSAHGYVRRSQTLRKDSAGNVALVGFQRSTSSTKEIVIFTVNLGIICGKLMDSPISRTPSVWDAHLRERIGSFLPERQDKWWQITAQTDAIALANDLSARIEELAVPYLDKFLDTEALIALWESGQSPGLTAVQRARFLQKLKSAS